MLHKLQPEYTRCLYSMLSTFYTSNYLIQHLAVRFR